MTTLSLLVPTHRPDRPLARCLASVANQLAEGDEVIVIGDTHDGPLPEVEMLVRDFGKQFSYLEYDAGHHCWGHEQLNYGLAYAKGDYAHCNDDDDVWTPDALQKMRDAIAQYPGRAFLFRFQSYLGQVFWGKQGEFYRGSIGGHCGLFPTAKTGRFTCAYDGDFDYLERSLENLGGPERAVWLDQIVAIARPA